jgi:dTDP-4-dehydrorhamnose reductase
VRLAVTGSSGRLGSAVVREARASGFDALAWTRSDFDLDDPGGFAGLITRTVPDVVVHCAAWTDVDGCAREPETAMQRNGLATTELARACTARDVGLVVVSTNEVFGGDRTDGRGYATTDATNPANPYGRSKLAGEMGARSAFSRAGSPLWIVRTAWLFGSPGRDFPIKILDAARAAQHDGRSLQLVSDEIGCPTYATDLARAILDLVAAPMSAGTHHVVNAGQASRAAWARCVLEVAGVEIETTDVPLSTWPRPSTPPRWGVLEPTDLPTIGRLRSWESALLADLGARGLLEAGASTLGAAP